MSMVSQLSEDWKLFVIQGLSILKERSTAEGVPREEHLSIREENDGTLVEEVVTAPVFQELVERNKDQLTKTSEYQQLAARMGADPNISRHVGKAIYTVLGGRSLSLWDYARFPLVKQLEKEGNPFIFDGDLFLRTLSDISNFLSKEEVVLVCVAPLQNFDSKLDELQLDSGLKIRKITRQESTWLMNLLAMAGTMPFFKAFQFKFVIEMLTPSPKWIENRPFIPVTDPFHSINKVVVALRLAKTGNVCCNMLRITSARETPAVSSMGSSREPIPPWGEKYLLNKEDASKVTQSWSYLKNRDLDKPDAVNVALRRFGFSYERNQPEDKMIDMMIAFEALLLKNEASSVHKIALRFSKLLERNFAERKILFKEMKSFYKTRSAIVHGGTGLVDNKLVKDVEERLRSCLWAILSKTQDHATLLSHLDLD